MKHLPASLVLALTLATTASADGLWITRQELQQLPRSGTAYSSVIAAATSTWGTPNLADQNSKVGLKVLAGAYAYSLTGDQGMRAKVAAAIGAAFSSFNTGTTNGVLALGRTLPAYVIAADLIELGELAPQDDAAFRAWLTRIRFERIGTHGRWYTLRGCHEDDAANWAAFAGAARLAASLYLGDREDVDRCASILRALLGERDAYPGGGYFKPSSSPQHLTWTCQGSLWTGINGPCTIGGQNLDGCPIMDVADGGNFSWPPSSMSYPWECFQGWYVQAEILYRTGRYGNPYEWSDQALRRGVEFMRRAGWKITNPANHVPWMANAQYGTQYATTVGTDGRAVAWASWTHAEPGPPPPVCTPRWDCDEWGPCDGGMMARACDDVNDCEPVRIEYKPCPQDSVPPPDTVSIPPDTTGTPPDSSGTEPPDTATFKVLLAAVLAALAGLAWFLFNRKKQ